MDKGMYMLDISKENMRENVLRGVSKLLDEYFSAGGSGYLNLLVKVKYDHHFQRDVYEFRIKDI